jgi:hypothetical protein
MPDKSKFEREIDEILEKTARESAQSDESAKTAKSERKRRSSHERRTFEPFSPSVPKTKQRRKRAPIMLFNPGQMIIGGLVIIAIAAFLPAATLPMAIIGVVMLGIGYFLWFRNGKRFAGSSSGLQRSESPKNSEPEVKYWRGRRIDDKPEDTQEDRGRIIDFGSPRDRDDSDEK